MDRIKLMKPGQEWHLKELGLVWVFTYKSKGDSAEGLPDIDESFVIPNGKYSYYTSSEDKNPFEFEQKILPVQFETKWYDGDMKAHYHTGLYVNGAVIRQNITGNAHRDDLTWKETNEPYKFKTQKNLFYSSGFFAKNGRWNEHFLVLWGKPEHFQYVQHIIAPVDGKGKKKTVEYPVKESRIEYTDKGKEWKFETKMKTYDYWMGKRQAVLCGEITQDSVSGYVKEQLNYCGNSRFNFNDQTSYSWSDTYFGTPTELI